MLAAMRRASSRVRRCAAERHPILTLSDDTRHAGALLSYILWECARRSIHRNGFEQYADTEADACAKLLIYLLENKLTNIPGRQVVSSAEA